MKRDTLQKKRRPVQKKKGLTLLYSKTRRKKQRVTASGAADLGSEVPNLGVARALFIILLLHVAAIGAIILHNRMTNDEPVVRKDEPVIKSTANAMAAAAAPSIPLPQVQQGEDYYFVATGDSYERVAQLKGVDVRELRALNENVPMKAGRILRIPPAGVATMAAAPVDYDTSNPPEREPKRRLAMAEALAVTTPPASGAGETTHIPAPRAVIVEPASNNSEVAAAPQAIRVRPQISHATAEANATAQKYTVKSGDTVWSISKRFSVSGDELLRLNGVSDPRKLKIGMTLVIPAS